MAFDRFGRLCVVCAHMRCSPVLSLSFSVSLSIILLQQLFLIHPLIVAYSSVCLRWINQRLWHRLKPIYKIDADICRQRECKWQTMFWHQYSYKWIHFAVMRILPYGGSQFVGLASATNSSTMHTTRARATNNRALDLWSCQTCPQYCANNSKVQSRNQKSKHFIELSSFVVEATEDTGSDECEYGPRMAECDRWFVGCISRMSTECRF